MPHLDARVLQMRGERAWTRKRPWYGLHVNVWNLCAPGLSPYSTGSGNAEMQANAMAYLGQGQPRQQILFDSTLAGDIEDHANHVTSEMFPAGRTWADMKAGRLFGGGGESENTELDRRIEKISGKIFTEIHASNFQLAVRMMIFDSCVSGTGCMKVGASRDASTLLDFEAVNQAQVAFEAGPRHSVWGFYRKLSETRDMIRVLWPDADLPPEGEPKTRAAAPPMHDLLECTTYSPDDGLWHYDVLMRSGSGSELQRIYEFDYVISPWIVWRYFLHPGEIQGRSRAMNAAPHAQTANHAVRVRLQSASIRVGGVYTFRGDDVFNPDTAHFQSGALLQVGSNDPQNPTLRPLDLPGDPQFGELVLADERNVIHERTLQDNLPDNDAPVRSATEIVAKQRKQQRRMGAPYDRLIEECARPVLRAVAYLMAEAGQLEELAEFQPAGPDGRPVPLMMNGKDIKLSFQTPMSRSQDLLDAENMARFGEMAPVVGGSPQAMLAAVKGEESVAILAKKMNYPTEAVYTQQERSARAEDARQAEMQQAMGPQQMQLPMEGMEMAA